MTLRSESGFDQSLALGLIIFGVLFRLFPHPDNFTPTMAIAFFSGVTLPPSLAFTVPLLVMMASDLMIGLHPLFWLVWGSFAAAVWIGLWVRKEASIIRVAAGALSGSVLFFVVTNLGVFLFESMYPKTWQGLRECYLMAVPFFRNQFLGDFFYSFAFFSLFTAVQWMKQPKRIS